MDTYPEVVAWLLDESQPSVRYRTLTGLLSRTSDDPEVQATRAAIPTSAPVQHLMAMMHPDGYWLEKGRGAGIGYAGNGSTHFVLAYLSELAMDRTDPRVDRAVERYLSLTEPDCENPAFWQIPPDYSHHQSCLYAYNLRTFIRLGYRDDDRIRERIRVLLADERRDGGYLCDRPSFRPSTKSCIRGSIKALTAFAELPELWGTPRCLQLVNYFLRRRLYYRMRAPDTIIRDELVRTIFPYTWRGSLIEPLWALSVMGYGQHPALDDAWARLATKADDRGRYVLDWPPSSGPFVPGKKSAPNKWVTLYAHLALKHRG